MGMSGMRIMGAGESSSPINFTQKGVVLTMAGIIRIQPSRKTTIRVGLQRREIVNMDIRMNMNMSMNMKLTLTKRSRIAVFKGLGLSVSPSASPSILTVNRPRLKIGLRSVGAAVLLIIRMLVFILLDKKTMILAI